ncbi:MAG TPA: phospholipase D family protein [Kiloniellaceae bacterium]|nr:phospholipase D family protein [Kiloniellaceae bacterium]
MARKLLAAVLAIIVAGCAALPEELPLGPPGEALAPQPGGALADAEAALRARTGPEESGFHLLDSNAESLRWRLALIDSARHSLDLQYYVWWGDESGALLMSRVVAAADRGVRVRLIVDDLSTNLLVEAAQERLSDAGAALIDAHPNIEVRLFNPWRQRTLLGQVFESIEHLDRVNQRMHNKLLVADNRAAIVGGRNVGNEYFGLSPEFGFRDLDTLGLGPVARQASQVFDRFWNSEQVVPADRLAAATEADLRAAFAGIEERLRRSGRLAGFAVEPQDWRDALLDMVQGMHEGTSSVLSDVPGKEEEVINVLPAAVRHFMEQAETDVTIANAYLVPGQEQIDWLKEQTARGVRYRILTNSLASHDVPAVNAHYKHWRRGLVEAGVELYETRPDAAIQAEVVDTPPVEAEFMGLHSKAIVIDRKRVFIGSMNLDPRSAQLNSEMGVVVESTGLAAELLAAIERDMHPENAWRVTLDDDGDVIWTAGDEVLHSQPARHFWQRVEDVFFMLLPKEIY